MVYVIGGLFVRRPKKKKKKLFLNTDNCTKKKQQSYGGFCIPSLQNNYIERKI